MPLHMLLIESPPGDLDELREAIINSCDADCDVVAVSAEAELYAHLEKGHGVDLVLIDLDVGKGERAGVDLVAGVRERDAEVPVVAVAEKGNVELAQMAVEAGATDFLVRTGSLKQRVKTLMGKVRKFLELRERNRELDEENRALREAAGERFRIIGESPQIKKVLDQIRRVATIPRPVLITGERGTGKELVARAIHVAAGRAGRPLVTVNCAAFADTLLESELFGHEKGSFTGADAVSRGKFETAKSGTLFLDEIGNMSLPFQQKILRVVEYGTFTRVGGSRELATDTRVIAATNSDLKKRMGTGMFLRDLYDRLAFEVIRVPPLREREGDIEVLALHFLDEFMKEIPALRGKTMGKEALSILREYQYPGNVRELKNIIERAAYRDTTNEINPEDIGMLPKTDVQVYGGGFEEKVDAFMKKLIMEAMVEAGGNQAQAARTLGLSYHQFRYYHRKFSKKK